MKRERDRESERIIYILGWCAIGLMLLVYALLKVFHIELLHLPGCIFKHMTGYYCPGCGGTRAVYYFLTGHWIKSFICHPLVPYMGIGGGIYMISHSLYYITKGKIQGIRLRNIYIYLMLVILVLQFIVKDFLIYQFHYYILG